MTLYNHKSFTVPATTPTKRPCTVHHFVKGQCLRCDQKIVTQAKTDPYQDLAAEYQKDTEPAA